MADDSEITPTADDLAEVQPRRAWDALTYQQQVFTLLYLTHFNAKKAAELSGYSSVGDSAKAHGSALLHTPLIRQAITETLAERGITREVIVERLAQAALGRDMAQFEPVLRGEKTLEELAAEGVDTRGVKSMSRSAGKHGVSIKLELDDSLVATRDLAKLLGYMVDRSISGTVDLTDLAHKSDEELRRMGEAIAPVGPDEPRKLP